MANGGRRHVGIVGAGISGLGAAHALAPRARVTVIEAAAAPGGHALTAQAHGAAVDMGFIVYNEVNYPRLTALFAELGVPTAPSSMSFGASFGGGRTEYALHSLDAIFAQRRHAASPGFLRMVRDILRFNARAEAAAAGRPDLTVGALIGELGLGARFAAQYLTPFSGAIWSTPAEGMMDFPAEALLRFFRNHGLLGHADGHAWRTVRGGSAAYVARLSEALEARGAVLRAGAAAQAVRRVPGGVEVRVRGAWERFDDVILAVHSDQAAGLVSAPGVAERAALGAIRYQPNEAVLHDDPRAMPRRRKCWASWNYVEPARGRGAGIPLTYWMNSLQPLETARDVFVTLNGAGLVDPARVIRRAGFAHPVYDSGTAAAQASVRALSGTGGLWYAGAWLGSGFHEDGLAAGQAAAAGILARGARAALAVAAE